MHTDTQDMDTDTDKGTGTGMVTGMGKGTGTDTDMYCTSKQTSGMDMNPEHEYGQGHYDIPIND